MRAQDTINRSKHIPGAENLRDRKMRFLLWLLHAFLFLGLCFQATLHAESPPMFRVFEFDRLSKKVVKNPDFEEIYRGQVSGGSLNLVQTNGALAYAVPVQEYVQTAARSWSWQVLPSGTVYRNYLAGPNESRMSVLWNHDDHRGWLADVTLGGRLPLLRYGPQNYSSIAEGFQVDLDGAAQLRADMDNNLGIEANNFKFGIPLSFGNEMLQIKTGYYHVSSNMTDRSVSINGTPITKKNLDYSRDSWILGISCQIPQSLRIYAEADYAFSGERMKPWHFQFGAEYSPLLVSSGLRGNLFAAINVRLLEERDFDGNLNVQLGWQWRGQSNRIFRVGVQYFGGISEQYEFVQFGREHKIGLGLWYDY